jgi:hypothetical protein
VASTSACLSGCWASQDCLSWGAPRYSGDGALRQFIADLVYSDSENARLDPEQRFRDSMRQIALEEVDRPVQVVAALPAEAPAGSPLARPIRRTRAASGSGTVPGVLAPGLTDNSQGRQEGR